MPLSSRGSQSATLALEIAVIETTSNPSNIEALLARVWWLEGIIFDKLKSEQPISLLQKLIAKLAELRALERRLIDEQETATFGILEEQERRETMIYEANIAAAAEKEEREKKEAEKSVANNNEWMLVTYIATQSWASRQWEWAKEKWGAAVRTWDSIINSVREVPKRFRTFMNAVQKHLNSASTRAGAFLQDAWQAFRKQIII